MSTTKTSTNVELDRELLRRARDVLHGATIKDTVEEGLRRIVAEQAMRDLTVMLAGMDDEQREILRTVRDRAW